MEAHTVIALSVFDAVLCLTLMGIAVRVLTTSDLFQAVVLFIVFGLLMSLAWTRLHAVDVAMAEAAIGAGLTGALFLNALAHTGRLEEGRVSFKWSSRAAVQVVLIGVSVWFAISITASFMALAGGDGLRALVEADIARSGATNPVTAVLLNFRAYDTMLEIAVLVLAVTGVWALGPAGSTGRPRSDSPGPMLLALVRLLVPLIGVVAGYLLWIGTSGPGGAFQAGAVLCAGGILLTLTGLFHGVAPHTRRGRLVVVLGFAVFLTVALGVMSWGTHFLQYPDGRAAGLILLIELLLTISIAAILLALFAGGEYGDAAGPAGDR